MRRAAMRKILEQEFGKRADVNVPFHEQAGTVWDAALAAMQRAEQISKRKRRDALKKAPQRITARGKLAEPRRGT